MSFEGIGSDSYQSEALFIEAFLSRLKKVFHLSRNNDLVKFIETCAHVDNINKLAIWLSELVEKTGKKTVLMIDEVDKSCNNQLFLDFLGMLRDKYLKHNEGEDITFHSVILAGVHDIKSLKIKLRPDDETKYNSPWNIAVDFDVDLSFFPDDIATMLEEYREEQDIKIDIPFFAHKLFYYTSGYPFLVSYLCKIINGKGFDFKDVQASEEKRLDVVITFENQKYIVELKIWHGESYHQEGIKQLYDYLDRQNLEKGYLLIVDLRKEKGKMGHYEKIETGDKEIFAAWV